MTEIQLARSGSEANRLIRQGAITVGGCTSECELINTGRCTCDGWTKITNPLEDVASGLAVKVGNGLWRLMPKLDGTGFDQVNGIGRVPFPPETPPFREA